MPLETMNQILGLATVDRKFAQELLEDPITAIEAHGFTLTEREKEMLLASKAKNLQELSQYILQNMR